MTKAEYQAEFGVSPVLPQASVLDNESPAPRRMTRAEYDAEFGVKNPSFKEKTLNFINEFNPFYQVPKMAMEGGLKYGESLAKIATSKTPSETGKSVAAATAGLAQGAGALPFGLFEATTNLPGVKQVKNLAWGTEPNQVSIPNLVASQIGKLKPLQDFTQKYPSSPEVASDLMTTGFGALALKEAGGGKVKTDVQAQYQQAYEAAQKQVAVYKENRQATMTQKVADEIANIESQYSKLRKINQYSKDAEASRQRIAAADVLPGAVDTTGTIHAKDAAEAYFKQTLEGKEAVVRENLKRLGETVNLEEVKKELILQINRSGLEGADLLSAMRNINKEIAGLKMRADEFGNVPLEKVHDAKINTTRNIDYNTPPEIKTYRKAVARAYKTVVEDKSSFNVREVNRELEKYYGDYERILNLEGRKVKGGKLGRYAAQIAGNIAGAAVGAAVGGLPGSAIGTIVGGETASLVKGKTMEGTFGQVRGLEAPKNPILEQASEMAKKPPVVDLKKPDLKVGAPKVIPKTAEVMKLEKEISKNVEAQKTAIKAGDFNSVATLKEIYQVLVEKLKGLVRELQQTNKQKGAIKNPLSDSSKADNQSGKELKQSLQSSLDDTTGSDMSKEGGVDKLFSEARKYKTAEEFVKAQEGINPLQKAAQDFNTADEFISHFRGSTTQYNKYTPELRKFGTFEESTRISDLGIDPNQKITIYRGIDDIEGSVRNPKINDGDFVTTDYESAKSYTGGQVISKEVRAKDLITDSPEDFNPKDPFYTGAEFIYSDSKNKLVKYSDTELTNIFNEAKSQGVKLPTSEWEKQAVYIQKKGAIPDNADWKGFRKSPEYEKYGTKPRELASAYYEYVSNKIDEAIKTKSQLTDIWKKANGK